MITRGLARPTSMVMVAISAALCVFGCTPTDTDGVGDDNGEGVWASISQIVAGRDAIVLVTTSGIYTETTSVDPTPQGGWPTGVPTFNPTETIQMTQYDASDHEMISAEALLDDGGVEEGQHFSMRMFGHPSDFVSDVDRFQRYPDPEGQYLVFLAKRQSQYFLVGGSMLRVDGETVTWSDGEAFPLASGMTTAQFLDAVRDEIEEQY